MPLSDDAFRKKVEEYKEVGHEYRYRDQLMVTEFSLSMGAIGIVLNAVRGLESVVEQIVVQLFGCAFLLLLTLHLRNINRDRIFASHLKDRLRQELEFDKVHQNVTGKRWTPIPRLMIRFSAAVTVIWLAWTVVAILGVIDKGLGLSPNYFGIFLLK
jgi:hypothetical protein